MHEWQEKNDYDTRMAMHSHMGKTNSGRIPRNKKILVTRMRSEKLLKRKTRMSFWLRNEGKTNDWEIRMIVLQHMKNGGRENLTHKWLGENKARWKCKILRSNRLRRCQQSLQSARLRRIYVSL